MLTPQFFVIFWQDMVIPVPLDISIRMSPHYFDATPGVLWIPCKKPQPDTPMLQTVSNRKIDLPIEIDFLGLSSYGDSQETSGVVRVTQDLSKPIEGKHPYVYLDGLWLKRCWGGEVKNVSVLVAIGVNEEGYREILGS